MIWRLPYLNYISQKSRVLQDLISVLVNPLTLRRELKVLSAMNGITTLIKNGRDALAKGFPSVAEKIQHLPHPCWHIPAAPLPVTASYHLLCFGFFTGGKILNN
jgi:hypothetical protein